MFPFPWQCEKQLPVKNLNVDPSSKKAVSISITEHQLADEDSDAEGDLVPVVIRPGHIRFTPSGKGTSASSWPSSNFICECMKKY